MATGFKYLTLSKPSVLKTLPEKEQQQIERNAAAARERLKNEKAASRPSQLTSSN